MSDFIILVLIVSQIAIIYSFFGMVNKVRSLIIVVTGLNIIVGNLLRAYPIEGEVEEEGNIATGGINVEE